MLALWPAWRAERVIYEDDDLFVVDKPEGVSTHAPEAGRRDDVHSRVVDFLEERGEEKPYLGIHQRLDKDTSGVLLFTRRKQANPKIAEQFERRLVKKVYVACVSGTKLANEGKLVHRLIAGKDGEMIVARGQEGGQEAITRYRVLERRGDRTLLEVVPETGRTHQIRVQLAAAGAPIAGDPLYRGAAAARLMLHARELVVSHPAMGDSRTFRSRVPDELAAWIKGSPPPSLEDRADVERRIRAAADRRYGLAHTPENEAFRVVNGAGDGLDGVTIDVYADHLVVSLVSEEAERAREAILDAAYALGPAGIYLKIRPKHASRIVDARREDFAPRSAVRGADAPESFVVGELGLSYLVRLGDGLSTGIFLDQRENRRRVRELSRGARVLNLFGYTGPFTVAAVAGGAARTTTVDVSKGALAWAAENLRGSDLAKHELVEADALVWMREAARRRERFDLVILDPPSFATTKRSTFSAESDYREVAGLALALVRPGGKLLACTNHRQIKRIKLRRYVHEAAREVGVTVVQMKDLSDPVDFPPPPGEEPHLKSLLVTVKP